MERLELDPRVRAAIGRYRPRSFELGLGLLTGLLLAKTPSHRLRMWAYRLGGLRAGPRVVIHKGLAGRHLSGITVGAGTIVGFDCTLDGRGGIVLGENVNLSSEVAIWTEQHDHRDPTFASVKKQVTVGDRAWLSFRTTILPGVTIGEGAVVAAGAVVVGDVSPYTVVAGVPARQVAVRPGPLVYEFTGGHPWFV